MPYQIFVLVYLVVSTIHSLLTRRYATKTTLNPILSAIPSNAVVALPLAVLYALIVGDFMMPSLHFLGVAILEAFVGTMYSALAIHAQKHADASTFVTLVKTHVIIVVLLSSIFLGEYLTLKQILGVGILIGSGLILSKGIHKKGLQINILAIFMIAIIVLLSRIAINLSNVGMVMVVSASITLALRLVFQGSKIKSSSSQLKNEFNQRSIIGLFQFLQLLMFMLAVDISGNVSLISSLSSLKGVTVMIASYIFLNERSRIKHKITAIILSLIGLTLI